MPYSLVILNSIYIYTTQILIGKFEKYISDMHLSKWYYIFSSPETDDRNEIISKLSVLLIDFFVLLEIKYMA